MEERPEMLKQVIAGMILLVVSTVANGFVTLSLLDFKMGIVMQEISDLKADYRASRQSMTTVQSDVAVLKNVQANLKEDVDKNSYQVSQHVAGHN